MKKELAYARTIFSADVLQEGLKTFRQLLPDEHKENTFLSSRNVQQVDGARWYFDSDEEFFAEYRRGFKSALFRVGGRVYKFTCSVVRCIPPRLLLLVSRRPLVKRLSESLTYLRRVEPKRSCQTRQQLLRNHRRCLSVMAAVHSGET
jgi:hypothetical protein